MASRPAAHPVSPYRAPMTGSIDQRLADMATEISRKADAGMANTAVHFIGFISPDGSTWRVSVDDTGALVTELVPRT